MKFIYMSRKGTNTIAGIITARHSFEALHNARVEAQQRGAEVRFISLSKIEDNNAVIG